MTIFKKETIKETQVQTPYIRTHTIERKHAHWHISFFILGMSHERTYTQTRPHTRKGFKEGRLSHRLK